MHDVSHIHRLSTSHPVIFSLAAQHRTRLGIIDMQLNKVGLANAKIQLASVIATTLMSSNLKRAKPAATPLRVVAAKPYPRLTCPILLP